MGEKVILVMDSCGKLHHVFRNTFTGKTKGEGDKQNFNFPVADFFDQILNAFGKVVITVIVMLKSSKIILISAAHTVER